VYSDPFGTLQFTSDEVERIL
jgi:hypothetical protein